MADVTTVEWVCATYPERIAALFEALDLGREGLAKVKDAASRGDTAAACEALLAYYRRGVSGQWLRQPDVPPGEGRDEQAEAVLLDTFTFYRQTDRVPRRPDGGLVWAHRGPTNDWEWTLALNRHHHLGHLLSAYRRTGNTAYANRIDEHLRDWVPASLPYPAQKNIGELWRGLEVSFRAKVWAEVFYALQQDPRLTPAARLLMLTSLPDHAHHLRNYHSGVNWLTMELSALGMIAAAWPEFKGSAEWMGYASDTLTRELTAQVYPDGAQDELTAHYHHVAVNNFGQFADICLGAGQALPEAYSARLEAMWHYLAAVMKPDGHAPLNNDSDLDDNRDSLPRAAAKYNRPDWTYIASNGAVGVRPDYGPSVMLPWAGQMVFRSGWDADALWAFFDLGPWGTAHQHNDKLHLSLSAYGRDLLVDSGRFVYAGQNERFRSQYALLSRAHNGIEIDSKGQAPGPRRAEAPVAEYDYRISPEMAFARGVCDHFEAPGRSVHTRVVVHLPGGLIVVADRVETDRPRTLDVLWHWHPRCTVSLEGQSIVSTDADQGNLRLVPVAEFKWTTALVKGQEQPHLQGWYSRRYNEWEPSTAAVLTAHAETTAAFAWLLLPARGKVESIRGEIIQSTADDLHIRVHRPDAPALRVRIPWRDGWPTTRRSES